MGAPAAFEGTRASYDAVASRYRDPSPPELDAKPFAPALLEAVAAG